MNLLSNPWQPNPNSALVAPPPRRISTPAGNRLSAIISDNSTTPGSSPRPVTAGSFSSYGRSDNRWSSLTGAKTLPRASYDTAPPAYILNEAEPLPDEEKPPTRDFKLGQGQRGGWKRFGGLVLVACVAISLGVGLGVGLSKRRHGHIAAQTPVVSNDTVLTFPVGQYSLATALRDVHTNCSSEEAAWRCYPYSTYNESPEASVTIFNWILSNTSAIYAVNSTSISTDSTGISANLSISSSDNPFSFTFDSIPLTYINNDSDPRYFFSYDMSQKVIPSSSITFDDCATACFFNQTELLGTLHLSNSLIQDFPSSNTSTSYTSWPFAVHIELVSHGGQDTPACYYTSDSIIGERITNISTKSTNDLCTCDYRNFS